MASSERLMKRILGWAIGVCIIVPAVAVSAVTIFDHVRTWQVCSRFGKLSPHEQLHWLQKASAKRDRRLLEPVRATLQSSKDRDMLQTAGSAAIRMGAVELMPLLQKRADEGPDDLQRAGLIIDAARLSDRDLRLLDWLTQGTRSEEPWRRAGSAVGLMHIGRLEAGPLLIGLARNGPEATRSFALQELAWIVRPMSEAVGQPLSFSGSDTAASIDGAEQFWHRYVTVSLLNDVLCRLTLRDPDWVEMGRLIHARDRVAKWLQ